MGAGDLQEIVGALLYGFKDAFGLSVKTMKDSVIAIIYGLKIVIGYTSEQVFDIAVALIHGIKQVFGYGLDEIKDTFIALITAVMDVFGSELSATAYMIEIAKAFRSVLDAGASELALGIMSVIVVVLGHPDASGVMMLLQTLQAVIGSGAVEASLIKILTSAVRVLQDNGMGFLSIAGVLASGVIGVLGALPSIISSVLQALVNVDSGLVSGNLVAILIAIIEPLKAAGLHLPSLAMALVAALKNVLSMSNVKDVAITAFNVLRDIYANNLTVLVELAKALQSAFSLNLGTVAGALMAAVVSALGLANVNGVILVLQALIQAFPVGDVNTAMVGILTQIINVLQANGVTDAAAIMVMLMSALKSVLSGLGAVGISIAIAQAILNTIPLTTYELISYLASALKSVYLYGASEILSVLVQVLSSIGRTLSNSDLAQY